MFCENRYGAALRPGCHGKEATKEMFISYGTPVKRIPCTSVLNVVNGYTNLPRNTGISYHGITSAKVPRRFTGRSTKACSPGGQGHEVPVMPQ